MKISEMLAREDFYSILPDTLNRYAEFLGIEPGSAATVGKGETPDLYVNEKLNAIIASKPSKQVKDYLRTEYTVAGSPLRKMAVAAYLTAALTFVKSNAQRGLKIKLRGKADDVLIYPCNKKIRLFDFSEGVVYTVLKEGFPDIYIKRETEFRLNKDVSFVPKIKQSGQGCYSETIIRNGRPLARIQDAAFVEEKKHESLELLTSLIKQPRKIDARAYVAELKERCLKMLATKKGFVECDKVATIFDRLIEKTQDCAIELVISHGDFQPGNIWIDENGKTVIIDWETVKERTPFYDYAALYCSLRNHGGLNNFCERVRANDYLSKVVGCSVETVIALILAEELEYQTEELISFPGTMGLEMYMNKINEFETTI